MGILANMLAALRGPDMRPVPPEPFGTIVLDPPWQFGDKIGKRGAEANYSCMTLEDLRRLELPPLLPDCRLFLWRVSAMVEEAYAVVRALGFVPKTELVWRKTTTRGSRHFGMGRTLRAEHETCIVATRGKPAVLNRSTRSVFDADEPDSFTGLFSAPVAGHSVKPDEFYALVEALSPGPLVELFSRRERPGWTTIGDQLPNPTTVGVTR